MDKLPTTIEEAEALFKANYPKGVCDCLIGIFRCEIKMGRSVFDAYKATLLSHLRAVGLEK